jgi:ubiquinone/menaquinone biosynthesis C-methylase UbiE
MQQAEFDSFADEYYAQHRENIRLSGEAPEYFAQYKIRKMQKHLPLLNDAGRKILDFGVGIGNSIPHLRHYFPLAQIEYADVSQRCVDIARARFPGNDIFHMIDATAMRVPLADESFDAVFTACVFHHIAHASHDAWLAELKRIVKPGGYVVVFEHNPFNPLTLRAVNTCPFDANAKLISAPAFKERVKKAGWKNPRVRYHIFFPAFLKSMRVLEPYLDRVPLGGQYSLIAQK